MHVCRGWRQVVYTSPLRLDLRILCTPTTPVRKNLGIWPALPICVYYPDQQKRNNESNEDNIVTALEQADRVCYVELHVTGSELEKISTVMRDPFPVLTSLRIMLEHRGTALPLPVDFLGGCAPRLRSIQLHGIPFPALPTFLLTTSDLVGLYLDKIPRTGYISPEEMVVGLAALPRLRTFHIGFQLATPHPVRRHQPPVTRTVLPSLTYFYFKGASEYLEDLVSRIDAPHLDQIDISYLNQLVDFQVPQLPMFIDRSVSSKGTPLRYARVGFYNHLVTIRKYRHAHNSPPEPHHDSTNIFCHGIDWQVWHIAQVVSHFSATLSKVVHLNLRVEAWDSIQLEGTDDVEWLHLLHRFPTVQTLHVCHRLAGHIALALEHIAWETVAEVLPSLDLIYLAGQPVSSIEKFVAARQLSGRPVTVIDKEEEFYQRVKSQVSE